MLKPRLARPTAVLGSLALIGALLWLSGRPWLTARGVDPLRGEVQVAATGRMCLPWLSALLLVGTAATLCFALAADRGRVGAALALFISGNSIAGSIAYFVIQLPLPRGQQKFLINTATITDTSASSSSWLALITAVLLVAWGAVVLLCCRVRPSAPAAGAEPATAAPEPSALDPIGAWDTLNLGEDPTK